MTGKPYCGCGDEITADDPGACGTCNSLTDEHLTHLRANLAASQEREQTLRDALVLLRCPEWAERVRDEYAVEFDRFVAGALRRALPGDDSALRARIDAEHERCAKVCDENAFLASIRKASVNENGSPNFDHVMIDIEICAINSCANAIRELRDEGQMDDQR